MTPVDRRARQSWKIAAAAVVLLPLLRELIPAGLFRAGVTTAQFLAVELGLALVAVFLRWGGRAGVALAAASALSGGWLAWFLGTDRAVFLPPDADVVAVALFLVGAVLTACLKAGGRPIAIVAGLAVLFGYAGGMLGPDPALPPLSSYAGYLAFGADGLLGRALDIMVSPVMAFVVFGALFDISGGGQAIAGLALRLAHRSRVAAVKACILASGMFGAISGTAISNVMTTGAFSIPAMRRIGLRNHTAAGIEAAASTSGQVMPPVMGAAAFLLADFAGETYGRVALASLLPAVGVYLAMFRQADLLRFPDPAPVQQDETTRAGPLRRAHALYLLPPLALVGMLAQSETEPARAALAGAGACLVVSLAINGLRDTWARLRRGAEALLTSGIQLVVIAGAMGLVLGVLNATGVAVALSVGLGALGQGNLVLALAAAAGAAFVLGMGMATVGVYVIAAALLAPGLIDAGVPPLATHMFLLYCGLLSMLTPPVALASLAASTLAGAAFGATARAGLRFGWILFAMPFLIVLRPGLVLVGGWQESVQAGVTGLVFILAATSAAPKPAARALLVAVAGAAVLWSTGGWVAVLLSLGAASGLGVVAYRARR